MPIRSLVGFASVGLVRPAEVLVLDSGTFTRLSSRTRSALSLIRALIGAGLWPAAVPTMVLVESLQGDASA